MHLFVSMTTQKWMAANHLYYLFIDKQIVGKKFWSHNYYDVTKKVLVTPADYNNIESSFENPFEFLNNINISTIYSDEFFG